MTLDVERLTRVWIEAFGEPPAVVDPELMMIVLADLGPEPCWEDET
jgi:hypothetical protein